VREPPPTSTDRGIILAVRERLGSILTVIVVGAVLASCDGDPPPDRRQVAVEVTNVKADLDCSHADTRDACDVVAHVTISNPADRPVRVRSCAIGRGEAFGAPISLGQALPLPAHRSAIARVEYIQELSYLLSADELLATEDWRAECQTAYPLPPAPQPQDTDLVALDCSSEFFLFGPGLLADNYGLQAFDAQLVAMQKGEYFDFGASAVEACATALTRAEERYEQARLARWAPYRLERHWLHRWSRYYSCALAVLNDYQGPARRLLQGSISVERAARAISFNSRRRDLSQPGYDGCLPGLKLGLMLRTA
jgi:hypothetical protein